jgi:16S rRNA processing protein RimM
MNERKNNKIEKNKSQTSKSLNKKLVPIGKIITPHGVKGQIKILSFCEPASSIFDFEKVLIQGKETKIVRIGVQKDRFISYIEGVSCRNMAEALKGEEIFIDRSELPQINSDDDFYIHDLIGLEVMENNKIIGKVISLQKFNSGHLVEIKKEDGKNELVEFTKANFPEINLAKSLIYLTKIN